MITILVLEDEIAFKSRTRIYLPCHPDSVQAHDYTSQEYSSCSILKFNKKDGYRQRNVRQFLQLALGTFWPPWVRPWDNRGKCHMDEKEDSMLVKCIAASTIHSSTVYELARYYSRTLQLFPAPLHLTHSLGCSHWNSWKKFGPQKTRIMGLPDSLTIG